MPAAAAPAPPSPPPPLPPPPPTDPVQYGDPTTSCADAAEALRKPMLETECRMFFHAFHSYAGENGNPLLPDGHVFARNFDPARERFGLCVLASTNTPTITIPSGVVLKEGDVLWTNHIFEDAPLCTTHVCHCTPGPSPPPPSIVSDDAGTSADNTCLTEDDCREAATALGYVPGMDSTAFVGQWTTKGCYAYDSGTYGGHAFFGTCGGTMVIDCTAEQMQAPVSATQTRIECKAPPSPPPSPPPSMPEAGYKRGLILSEEITTACLSHFDDRVHWVYDYSHRVPKQDTLNWINLQKAEFVPAVHGFRVDFAQDTPGGATSECYLTQAMATKAGGSKCSGNAQLSAQLTYLKSQLDTPVRYIFLANEPWKSAAHDLVDIDEYVEAFYYITGAAFLNGLKIVSPTVRRGTTELTGGAWWLANFIAACDADTTHGCDPDKIEVFDLVCKAHVPHTALALN